MFCFSFYSESVNDNSNEHGISISTNSAYGTVKFGSGVPVQQPISQPSEPTITSQTGDRVYMFMKWSLYMSLLHLVCMKMSTSNVIHVCIMVIDRGYTILLKQMYNVKECSFCLEIIDKLQSDIN